MEKILFIILSISCSVFASPIQYIEIGDSIPIKASQSLWIENSKVLKAVPVKNPSRLTAIKTGRSLIKMDGSLKTLIILDPGSNLSYSYWKQLIYQFPSLTLEDCAGQPCLKGKINLFSEFLKIVDLNQKSSSPILFAFKFSDKIKSEIEKWYSSYFRENGLTPLKIIYAHPWSVFMSKGQDDLKIKYTYNQVGLMTGLSNQKIEIADNIKVEIRIVEVKKEFLNTLGIRWPNSYTAQVIPNHLPKNIDPFEVSLEANERSGDMTILASPNLICRSGKEASFFAGGEFPIRLTSLRQSSVQWKKYGINLSIKPLIDSAGQISLELETEISTLDKSREIDGIPAIHSHKVSSHFDLINSKTIALSGLVKNESGVSSEGLPYLSQIPVLGSLFSSKSFLENKTELLILVKPELMDFQNE